MKMSWSWFIYCLFNDAFGIPEYITLTDIIINQYWIWNDTENVFVG
jgi:hypothetical protein